MIDRLVVNHQLINKQVINYKDGEGLRQPWRVRAAEDVPARLRVPAGAGDRHPAHHPHRLARPPPHQTQVLPAGRLRLPAQPLHPRQHPLLRHPGHHLLPQPQQQHRHLLRPRRRLRLLQVINYLNSSPAPKQLPIFFKKILFFLYPSIVRLI